VVPVGIQVLHTRDTRSCVNPDHLFLGTNTDNMRDASKKHRFNQVGQNNGAAKLTELDVAVIRSMEGTQREIARKSGIDQPDKIRKTLVTGSTGGTAQGA
jgi:hypothetical protein